MAEHTKKSDNRGFWSSLLRTKRDHEELPGLQIGSVFSQEDLLIAETAVVAGDVVAPRVIVHGLVHGHIGARELVIHKTGRIWGDVFAGAVHIEPGAQLYGWVTTLSETAVAQLLSQETDFYSLFPETEEIPSALLEESGLQNILVKLDTIPPDQRLNFLHEMQYAAGRALVAYAELKGQFETKLDELVRGVIREAEEQHDQLVKLQEEMATAQETIQARDETVAAQQAEIAEVQGVLEERMAEVEAMRLANEQQETRLSELQAQHEALNQQFTTLSGEKQSLTERLGNVESGLQASLQRAAEQEEALIHWQELADTNEEKVTALQQELDEKKQLLNEANQQLAQIQDQLGRLQEAHERLTAQHAEQQELAVSFEQQVHKLEERIRTSKPAADETIAALLSTKDNLTEAENRITELEGYLQRLETEARDYFDQLATLKSELDENKKQLTASQAALHDRTRALAQTQAELAEQREQVHKWKESIGHMTDLLYNAENRVKELQEALDSQQPGSEEHKKLLERLQQQQQQLAASDAEADHFQQEIQNQSKRLAEAQAALVESEIALNRSAELLAQKENELKQVKKAAVVRIQQLEQALAQSSAKPTA
jgi:chromosome segregation ATPase/cytoskeletal protein CcmA (bactofilin family)